MKTMIALGLVMLSLLLLVALRRTDGSPHPVAVGKPASAQSQQMFKVAHTRRAASHALTATQQAQPGDAILPAVVDAELDPDLRSQALERVVESIPDADLPAVLDSLANDVIPEAAELRQLLVRRWAERDAPAVAAWTSQMPESAARRAALEQVAIAWANTDLAAAAGWVRALPEGDSKQAATQAVAYEAARTEPAAALELASALPPTRERDDLLVHAVSQWAAADPAAAVAWALGIPELPARERVLAAAAIARAEQDGASAATLAAQALRAGDEQDRTVVAIVQRWAQNSPLAAASWVSEFPDLPSRDTAVQSLLAVWTARDADVANHWLQGLSAGSLRDVGMAAYAEAIADRDRVGAIAGQNPVPIPELMVPTGVR